MKQRIKITALSVLIIFLIQGCKKDFLNRPPLASPTAGTYYANDNDILSGTGPLYNAPWNSYNGTTMNALGDVLGGNLTWDNYQGRGAYINFSVSSTDPSGSLSSSYNTFWSVVANANVVAYNIQNAAPGASTLVKNAGLAECRFMRAAAYYYLALNWGPVPIIYDNSNQIGDKSITRNNLEDVWKFIIMDLTWAKNNLPSTPLEPGRVTKWSAEGMLARAYLIRSGLGQSGGTRKQGDLDSAKFYAGDVCHNSGLSLYPNYYDLFTSKVFSGKNIPQESLFSLLWVPTGSWFVQNHKQAYLAYDSKITQTGDGWGSSFGAAPSLLQYYFDPANKADSVRRKATFFMPNDFYPDINQAAGGWRVDTTLFNHSKIYVPGASGNGDVNDHAFPKKYVIGAPSENGGLGGSQNINMHTYMFRLAEVYLIYADAILGNQGSTSDPEALKYFNLVRSRAGVPTKTSITYADIFLEKKIEFALEGHAWYDWKQWYYFDPAKATQYFSTQDRGAYNISYNNGNPFITFFGSDNKTPGTLSYAITPTTVDLPYPEAEKLVSPNLAAPPAPFDFSKLKY
jgi:hypothetical protein